MPMCSYSRPGQTIPRERCRPGKAADAVRNPIALTVLTGFLGAGKTTLLNRLLKDPDLTDTAVVINEFGDVAIDHLLVENATDGIVEIGGGCLCCTVRGELTERLAALAERSQNLRRVVVETSGLADPLPLLQPMMAHPEISRLYRLEAVITAVDAVNGLATLKAYEEAQRQIAVADRIVITKRDLAADNPETVLVPRLAAINADAEIVDSRDHALNAAALLRPLFAGRHGVKIPKQDARDLKHDHHHADYLSFTLKHEGPLPLAVVEGFLDLVASQQGERLLRIKGLVETVDDPGRPVLIQGAQRLLHPPERLASWPEGAPRGTHLVLIGRDLDTHYVRRIFSAFLGQPLVDTPDRTALEASPLAIPGFRF